MPRPLKSRSWTQWLAFFRTLHVTNKQEVLDAVLAGRSELRIDAVSVSTVRTGDGLVVDETRTEIHLETGRGATLVVRMLK